MAEKIKSAKAHTRYRNKDGKIVPGATTILGVLNKPALVKWANNLGLQGIDSTKYVDVMAKIGTLAHYMVESYLKSIEPDTSSFSKDEIDKAENAVLSFFEWERHNQLEPFLLEKQLVSEQYQFGGTVDCYCKLNGKYTLLDFKTSNAIYAEHIIQLSAYKQLLRENGYKVDEVRILRIGRTEDEGFEERKETNLSNHWTLFEHLLEVYRLQKIIKKVGA